MQFESPADLLRCTHFGEKRRGIVQRLGNLALIVAEVFTRNAMSDSLLGTGPSIEQRELTDHAVRKLKRAPTLGAFNPHRILGLIPALAIFEVRFGARVRCADCERYGIIRYRLVQSDLTGSFCTKRIDRNWLGKEHCHAEEEAQPGADCDAAAAD